MYRRASLLCGLCLALTGAASVSARARKPPAHVRLDYRRLAGAERCPGQHELEQQVSQILGQRPFTRKAPRTVRCVLRGEGAGIAARVQLLDTRSGRVLGVRELSGTGPGCEELGGAVALAIALAVDPLAKPPPSRPPPASASAGPVVVSPPPPPLPRSTPSASSPPAFTSTPGVSATVPQTGRPDRTGPLPDAGPLASLGLVPLALASSPDAGRPPVAPDAGPLASLGLVPLAVALGADAGRPPAAPDAGPPPRDAGPVPLDAGTMAPDAGPGTADAGLRAPDAGTDPLAVADAGPEVAAVDAGLPAEALAGPEAAGPASTPSGGWRPVAGVGVLGAAGVLPGVAGGVLVHAGAASSTASVELEGRWLPGTSTAFGTGTISTKLVSGAVVGCARFGSWSACGLTQAGPLSAKGQGYSRSQEATAWMVSVGARGQWEWLFADPVGLRLHLDGAVNVVRPRLLVDSQEAWAVPPVSVWVGGGLFGRF
ncbi:MAG TPA: hypothetical protein VLT82_19280 [Myxococcaceae bacterium]|nr:hypothetical protein [Myxococcaceae bacterium]